MPQTPGHGSLQRSFRQARLLGHSALNVHSGRQFGARPTKFGRQEHAGCVPTTLHCELGPQGEGLQGFPTGAGVAARIQDTRQVQNMLKVNQLQRQTLKNLNIQWNKKERWNKKISDSKNRRTKVLFFAGRKTLQEIYKMSSTEPLNDWRFCRGLIIKMKVFESETSPSLCQAKMESHCKATAIWRCLLSYTEGQLKDIFTIHL